MPSLPSLVTFAQFLATCGSFPVLLILGYLVSVPVSGVAAYARRSLR